MVRQLPVTIVADALFDIFKRHRPDLLGVCETRDEYRAFAVATYSHGYNEASCWVVVRTRPGDHRADLHVYDLEHRISERGKFFDEVLDDLASSGKHRIVITLMPNTGHTVRKWLKKKSFTLEGILHDYYAIPGTSRYADAENWVRLQNVRSE